MPDDPYEGLGTPVAPPADPYAGLGTPVDAYGQPRIKNRDPSRVYPGDTDAPLPTPITQNYDPKVTASPLSASDNALDWTARNIAEPYVTPAMGALGTVLGTLGRGARTYLEPLTTPEGRQKIIDQQAGSGIMSGDPNLDSAAYHNMFVKPEDAPTFPQIKKNLGIPNAASAPSIFDHEGNVNWGQAALHGIDAAVDMAGDIATDPGQIALLGVHPGVSPEFAASEAAARDAVRAGTLGKFASPAEAAAAMPGFSDAVAAGQAGLNLKVPFGPQVGFLQTVPRALAPAIKWMDPLVKVLTKSRSLFTGPEAGTPEEILKTQQEGRTNAEILGFMRETGAPLEAQAAKAQFTPETMSYLGDAGEAFDRDGSLKVFPGAPAPEGPLLQGDFDSSLKPRMDGVFTDRPDVYREALSNYARGSEHFNPALQRVYEHASTLTPAQQATFWDMAPKVRAYAEDVRQFANQRGLDIPDINADVKALPSKILDVIDAIKEQETRTPFKAASTMTPSESSAPVQALIDHAGGKGLDVPVLSDLIERLRTAKPDEIPAATPPGKFEMQAAQPEPPRNANAMADELAHRRLKTQASATQRATGTPNEFELLNQLSREDLTDLKNSLYEKLPQALKQYNAVPAYRPGTISQFTRDQITGGKNPNLPAMTGPMNPENAERGGLVADIGRQYADMGNVKKTVAESAETNAKGTAATSGEAVPGSFLVNSSVAPPPWWEKFMTKTGLREVQKSGGRPFYEPDPLKALRSQLEHPIAKAITNAGLAKQLRGLYDAVPADTVAAMQGLIYDGVETGESVTKAQPNYYHSKRGPLVTDNAGLRTGPAEPRPWANEVEPAPAAAREPVNPYTSEDPFEPRSPEPRGTMDVEDLGPWRSGMPNEELGAWIRQMQEKPVEPLPNELRGVSDFSAGQARPRELPEPNFPDEAGAIKFQPDPFERGMNAAREENPAKWQYDFPKPAEPLNPLTEDPYPFLDRTTPNLGTDEPARFEGPTKDEKVTRPPTLEDAEELWRKSGRTDRFYDNLNPEAKAKIDAGVPLDQVVERNWTPASRALSEDLGGYIHKGVVNDFQAYKQLGSDPTGFTNWLRRNAPLYVQALKLSKAVKTLWGPFAPGYVATKAIHDSIRGEIGRAWDWDSPGEILRGQSGHWQYADSGGMDPSGLPEYNFGAAGRLSGADAAAIGERTRAMGSTGETAYEFQRGETEPSNAGRPADSTEFHTGDYGTSQPVDLQNIGRKMANFVRSQDTGMRLAAVAGYMRQGMSEGEAAFMMQRAFFDFTRKGPVTQILSQTGIVPFAAWQAKILPFMAKWAMENPGEFVVVQKALQAMNAGIIPPSQVPNYIRGGTNIPVSVHTDKAGHTKIDMLTDDGNVPGDELMHLSRDPLGYGLSKMGDPIRALFTAHDQAAIDAADPERVTWGEWAKKFGRTAAGRPGSIISTLGDPEKTPAEKVSSVFNPMQLQEYDFTKQGIVSRATAKDDLKRALFAVNDAGAKLRAAQSDLEQKAKTMQQVNDAEFQQADTMYQKAAQELQDAKDRVVREQGYVKKVKAAHDQAQAWVDRMTPAK